MAGPANLHQIRFLVSGLLGETEERIVGRVNEVADEVAAMQRKETMSRTVGRVARGACMWRGSGPCGRPAPRCRWPVK